MRKLLWLALAGILVVSACTSSGNRPTVCEQIQEPSILCQVAKEKNIRLEDIGNGLILVNAVAISEGVYTRGDAKHVLEKLSQALDGPVTYVLFKDQIIKYTNAYPGLLDVAMVYLDEFSLSKRMYEADRDILKTWLTSRIKSL